MNFAQDRALNRRIVISARQWDHLFCPGERIDHKALKLWGNNFVILGQQKNCGRIDPFCIGDTIEIARNLRTS